MDKNRIIAIKADFDAVVHCFESSHMEYWYARELMPLLGYGCWENFDKAIARAMESCGGAGSVVSDHFSEITKMVSAEKGAQRKVLK